MDVPIVTPVIPTLVLEPPAGSSQPTQRRLDLQATPDVPANSFVENNRINGMKLTFINPMLKNGSPTACLQQNAVDIELKKWANAVILYVIGDNPTIKYISTFVDKQWLCESKPEIFLYSEGYFLIRFGSVEEKERVLCSGPYTIANRPAIVKGWSADFNFNTEILKLIPLWIKLPNLPLNCWGMDSLSRIGSTLGNPLFADECTTTQNRISFARMLVEVDVTHPLLHKVMVEDPHGKAFEQVVQYEWEPKFCDTCQKLGHNCVADVAQEHRRRTKKIWVPKVTVARDTSAIPPPGVPSTVTGDSTLVVSDPVAEG
ncbi:uncharacterized protein [Spinacia oleracea]|uniref:DUF4283 domain-containing protein n=1 Tax=Spinacia oleracea TaxID=3562 RepID=A0ABM3QQI7_SPIOL|nr:uncharacterized protein LOC130461524 [Spinacia oleracea]